MITIPARWVGRVFLIVTVLGTIGCDHVTKHVASRTLAGMPGRSYLADTVWLAYAENPGGFLSQGADLPPGARHVIFTLATGLMLIAVTTMAIRYRWGGWPALGTALFVAGGMSNWIDRLLHGSVVDFLNVGIGPLRTGIFNVADVAITIGGLIFVVAEFVRVRHHPA